MRQMLFFWILLIGMVLPVLLIKIKSRWAAWIPTIIFGLATLIMGGVAVFFPGEGMADLGKIIYFMLFGVAAIGSLVGGVIVHFIKNGRGKGHC